MLTRFLCIIRKNFWQRFTLSCKNMKLLLRVAEEAKSPVLCLSVLETFDEICRVYVAKYNNNAKMRADDKLEQSTSQLISIQLCELSMKRFYSKYFHRCFYVSIWFIFLIHLRRVMHGQVIITSLMIFQHRQLRTHKYNNAKYSSLVNWHVLTPNP